MRAFLISSALAAALVIPPAAALEPVERTVRAGAGTPASLLPVEPEAASPPSILAPLAADSAWVPRFEAAADELAAALRSRDEAQWAPLLGGQWLTAAGRERVGALLRDRDSPFLQALFSKGFTHRALLGWHAPASLSADERAAIEEGKEAESLVCWSTGGSGDSLWPTTAREADNRPGRPYACARIAYSIRGDTPTWRAFID